MTTWMITHYHDWRVAVAGAPVTDILADYATADDINADRELFRGSPWVGDNRADYVAQSPLTYVKDVTTPVLLMTTAATTACRRYRRTRSTTRCAISANRSTSWRIRSTATFRAIPFAPPT